MNKPIVDRVARALAAPGSRRSLIVRGLAILTGGAASAVGGEAFAAKPAPNPKPIACHNDNQCPPSGNPCTLARCDRATNQCVQIALADGSPCAANGICAAGACYACGPGTPGGILFQGSTRCPNPSEPGLDYCVNVGDNPNNCGACGVSCPTGQSCCGGICRDATACPGCCCLDVSNPASCFCCGQG